MKDGREETVLVATDNNGLRVTWLFAREGALFCCSVALSEGNGRLPIGDGDVLIGDLGGGTGLRR